MPLRQAAPSPTSGGVAKPPRLHRPSGCPRARPLGGALASATGRLHSTLASASVRSRCDWGAPIRCHRSSDRRAQRHHCAAPGRASLGQNLPAHGALTRAPRTARAPAPAWQAQKKPSPRPNKLAAGRITTHPPNEGICKQGVGPQSGHRPDCARSRGTGLLATGVEIKHTPSWRAELSSGRDAQSVLSADINFVQREEQSSARATVKTPTTASSHRLHSRRSRCTHALTFLVALTLG